MLTYFASVATLETDETPDVETFGTPADAWSHLYNARCDLERGAPCELCDDTMSHGVYGDCDDDTETGRALAKMASWARSGLVCDFEAIGSVLGTLPGGEPDEAIVYAVTAYDVDEMARHYAVAALWSSPIGEDSVCGEDYAGENLDAYFGVDAIHPDTYAEMVADCLAFVIGAGPDLSDMTPEQAGHDFWLTRNGHGAGFWDRGLGARGERLSVLARPYGEVNLWTDGEYVRGEF